MNSKSFNPALPPNPLIFTTSVSSSHGRNNVVAARGVRPSNRRDGYNPTGEPPTALEILLVTVLAGGSLQVTYVAGDGGRASTPRLRWQVVGVDADNDNSEPVALNGQTVNLIVRASNVAGHTDSAVKMVTIP